MYERLFQAENTFILTLDGDVDFNPYAVRLLVDRLKTNKKVGARVVVYTQPAQVQ